MGIGIWLRRGDRQPGTPPRGGAGAETGHAPEPEADRSDSGAGQRDGVGGGDWDGGWRQVAPPTVTVARSSIGVSDGLRFRDGLASWQDLAFGSELGHAVLPSAPVGLIHGVARPGSARSESPGGPLLLRAARTGTDGEAEPAAGLPSAAAGSEVGRGRAGAKPAPATTTVQRASRTVSSRPSPAPASPPRSSSSRSSGSGAPGHRTGGGGATAPEATAEAAPAKGTAPAAAPGPASSPAAASASRHPAGAAPAPVSPQRARPAAVRPRRTAPPLIIARRPAMALRHIAGILPATTSASATPVTTTAAVQQGASHQTAPAGPDAGTDRPTAAPVRPALGKPLRELPTGAVPSGPAVRSEVVPSAPEGQRTADMPVLQRQTSETETSPATPSATSPVTARSPEAAKPSVRQPSSPEIRSTEARSPEVRAPRPPQPDRSGSPARARGGIGTPLPSLPPTARLRNDAPLLGDRRGPQPGTAGPRQGATPTGEPGAPPPSVPAKPMSKLPNEPSAMPVRTPPVAARSDASAPQPAVVQRAADTTRPSSPVSTPAPAAPVAPVRVRRITPERRKGRTSGPASSAAGPMPAVQRSRALLAGRALKVSTGSSEGFSAPASGSAARPVVAATWRRDGRQPGSDVPSPGPGSTRTGEHRTPPGAASGPALPHPSTRPSDPAAPHRTRATGRAPTHGGPTPGTAAPGTTVSRTTERGTTAPGGTVQRLVPGSPSPGTTRSGTHSGRTPAGDPTRVPGAGPGTVARVGADRTGRGTGVGGSLLRLVQRSVRGGATTPPSRPDAHLPERSPVESDSARRPGPPSPPPRPAPPTAYVAPSAPLSAPSAAQPVPVVRPHPPATDRPGAAAVPVQRMAFPVVADSGAPMATGPAAGAGAPLPGPPSLSVRVPRRAPAPAAGAGASGATAEVLQRAAADAGITGVPVRAAPVKPAAPSGRTGPAGSADSATADAPPANRVTAADIEELARRLLDPVSRLIRADMRRGRERTGRLYDGRR